MRSVVLANPVPQLAEVLPALANHGGYVGLVLASVHGFEDELFDALVRTPLRGSCLLEASHDRGFRHVDQDATVVGRESSPDQLTHTDVPANIVGSTNTASRPRLAAQTGSRDSPILTKKAAVKNVSRYVLACPDPDRMAAKPLEWFQLYTRDLAPTITAVRTLWHRTCQHLLYELTCADYELMLEEAGYACTRCGKPNEYLGVDHDYKVGWHGVRNLLCPKCNTHLGFVDSGRKPMDELTARYLANPFQRRHPFVFHPRYSEAQLERRKAACVKEARRLRGIQRATDARAAGYAARRAAKAAS